MNVADGAQILRVLGSICPVRLDRFDDRLRMQMLAYLIQEVGGHDDFTYYWYARGPYSPALAQALSSERGARGRRGGPALSDAENALAGAVRSLVRRKTDDPLALELYASLWFLTPKRRLSGSEKKSIATTMRHTKPHFTEKQVAGAMAEIEAFRRGGRP